MSVETQQYNTVTFFIAPASRLGIEVDVIGPDQGRPLTLEAVMSRSGVEAALNGPMFSFCANTPRDYGRYDCAVLDYEHRDGSVQIEGSNSERGSVLSVVREFASVRAVMTDPASAPAAAMSVQLYPTLIRAGRNVANVNLNNDHSWRSAACITRDGKIAFALGRPQPMFTFADDLRASGLIADAGYTDGGGSSAMARKGAARAERVGSSEGRRVPSWLVFRAFPRLSYIEIGLVAGGLYGLGGWAMKRYGRRIKL